MGGDIGGVKKLQAPHFVVSERAQRLLATTVYYYIGIVKVCWYGMLFSFTSLNIILFQKVSTLQSISGLMTVSQENVHLIFADH